VVSRLLAIAVGISLLAPALSGRSSACAQVGTPTARVCAIRDFGKTIPGNARVTADPTWFTDLGVTTGADSNIYSTGPSGGRLGGGAAFRITPQGALTVLAAFDNGVNGGAPKSGLVDGKDGWFYGTTYGGGKFKTGTLFRVRSDSGSLQVLYHFRNSSMLGIKKPCDDGRCPYTPKQKADAYGSYPGSPPVPDGRGNFYGVTAWSANQAYGTLYVLGPPYDSTGFSTLCIFDPSLVVRDSTLKGYICHPKITAPNSVILAPGASTIYGTTTGGDGSVFSATLDGKVTLLHQFTMLEGSKPVGLMQGSDGRLYGTTAAGGPANLGIVYALSTAGGAFATLATFKVGTVVTGYGPLGGVVEGKVNGTPDGFLYGTARYGGRYGAGIFYRVGTDGKNFSVLHDFNAGATGTHPMTAPVQDREGSFYGLTYQGGAWNSGTLYRLTHAEYPPRSTSPVTFSAGNLAKDANGVVLKDSLVEVRTNVAATQGRPATDSTNDGISVRVACRNPHFVQFIYRERISALGFRLPGTVITSSGRHQLTTDMGSIQWHTDAVGKPNAYYEEGPRVGYATYVTGATTYLTTFDQPTFAPPMFDMSQQDPQASETWRATVKLFAICNCQVVREIRWVLEKVGGKQTWKDISIRPADNAVLPELNAKLKADGYDPVP
jgi:uncharacterized repeat protein (TIGR03803 family)